MVVIIPTSVINIGRGAFSSLYMKLETVFFENMSDLERLNQRMNQAFGLETAQKKRRQPVTIHRGGSARLHPLHILQLFCAYRSSAN